jgi:hypothetical protein
MLIRVDRRIQLRILNIIKFIYYFRRSYSYFSVVSCYLNLYLSINCGKNMDQNLTYGISEINTGLEIFTISFSKVLADIIFIQQSNMSLFLSTSYISDIFSRKRTYIGKFF